MPRAVAAATIAMGFMALVTLCFRAAVGTPVYSARAGRTCDNCHVTPNNWVNPKLSERKCSLACQGCHVDPAGGGMRSASGRFYGRATLPMIATSPRPTRDWDRNIPFLGRRDRATSYNDNLPEGPYGFADADAYTDSIHDYWGLGRPQGPPTRYGHFQGRYGDLNADPFFRIGWDIRLAALQSGTLLRFPMQIDVPMYVHPVHHLTVFANTGFRGRPSGYSDTFESDHSLYFREAFVLLHEAPYQAYAKLGRFVPAYGLRLDDHTSQIRRQFELDGALPESRVTGVEVGMAPNYPFLNLSYFKMTAKSRVPRAFDIFDVDSGWGFAVNAGYRNLGWSVGGSALVRNRPLDEGGDTSTFGAYAALNPWFYLPTLPFTYQAEYDVGDYERASGRTARHSAFYQEVDWLLRNGLNLLLAHDWADPDHDVIDDDAHRISAGAQIIPYPGVSIDGRLRLLVPAAGGSDSDMFVQFRLWN